jgi:hypothetical protein
MGLADVISVGPGTEVPGYSHGVFTGRPPALIAL